MQVTVRTTTSGPLFRNVTPRAMRQASKDTLQDAVERGEQIVTSLLYPGHGLVTGHLRRSIVGEVGASIGTHRAGQDFSGAYFRSHIADIPRTDFHGVLHDSGVVYGPWIEGVSSRNDASRFKGYQMFRRATRALNTAMPRLAQRHLARAVRRLNGA